MNFHVFKAKVKSEGYLNSFAWTVKSNPKLKNLKSEYEWLHQIYWCIGAVMYYFVCVAISWIHYNVYIVNLIYLVFLCVIAAKNGADFYFGKFRSQIEDKVY